MGSKLGDCLQYFIPDWPCVPQRFKSANGKDGEPRTVNLFLGFFFMVNFVLGTGFLGIPFGFVHGGLLVGIITLTIVAVMAWLCALWEVEAMARAQAIWEYRSSDTVSDSSGSSSTPFPKFYIAQNRKFEPSELCEVFVGRWLKIVYLILFSIYSSLACISYSTVVGTAWSVNLPLNFGSFQECSDTDFLNRLLPAFHPGGCLHAYWFCLMLFAVLVVPISLLDLKEQAIVQLILGLLRFFTLGAIIIYCLVYLFEGDTLPTCDADNNDTMNSSLFYDNSTETFESMDHIVFHFNFYNWVAAIPVFVYAFILHQGIPGLTHPIRNKKYLRGYFNLLFLLITFLYGLLGVVVALWFRDCVNETCTLNWHPMTSSSHHAAIRALSYYIIIFPSIDVCSVFPLMIHTIVNNIYTVVFGRDTSQTTGVKHKLIQVGMKFTASILPIVIGFFVSNLVYVLKYAGLLGFFISLFFPMLFQLSSQWVCCHLFTVGKSSDRVAKNIASSSQGPTIQEKQPLLPNGKGSLYEKGIGWFIFDFLFTFKYRDSYKTPYSTPLSYPICVIGFFVVAVICFVLTIISLFVKET
ncbi:PREDICTED: uncharacterized protein LOC100633436 [Amphimedon queenslandica]|uniref:Amino acid transporter transmembrane domain-containing protein n=1 Tax=Amphimedon queenslandica TaxID=400682 RepID=A0A1X7UGI9_AMPQE|nr:PREDICTED: uncharacterized protein LOC100633436 [Amphimedon queenslandica]|eukprot:XP_003388035.1 PREDICTED: uncharacterized protein LOC100633436 [Amphimedon queenslandica]